VNLFQPLANNPNTTIANGVNGGDGTAVPSPSLVAMQSTNTASGITSLNIAVLLGIVAMMMML
jgi:hypothetical protein